jgi:hypothetical protein
MLSFFDIEVQHFEGSVAGVIPPHLSERIWVFYRNEPPQGGG